MFSLKETAVHPSQWLYRSALPPAVREGTTSSLALGVSGVGFWPHKKCLGVAHCCLHFPPDNM